MLYRTPHGSNRWFHSYRTNYEDFMGGSVHLVMLSFACTDFKLSILPCLTAPKWPRMPWMRCQSIAVLPPPPPPPHPPPFLFCEPTRQTFRCKSCQQNIFIFLSVCSNTMKSMNLHMFSKFSTANQFMDPFPSVATRSWTWILLFLLFFRM